MLSRKMVLMGTDSQGKNRDTDIENGFVNTVGEGDGGIKRVALTHAHYHV